MENSSQRKLKLLVLRDILLEETDDEHGLTMPQLLDRLEDKGISAERKALYDDIEALEHYGLDIIKRRGKHTEYAVGARQFELPELLLLADAAQSSRFLTKHKSDVLINKLEQFTSQHQRTLLEKSMHVEGRIKMQNESVYYNIDTIQATIRDKKKITFQYFDYGFDKKEKLRREGNTYVENPVDLVYKDEYYYLITYNETHDKFLTYRVDRMKSIKKSDEPLACTDKIRSFDVQEFTARAFSMFDGETIGAVLLVDHSLIGPIIDRFGKDVPIYRIDDNTARITVHILKSPVFFGWLAQFGTSARIESPQSLVNDYKEHLQSIVQTYEN